MGNLHFVIYTTICIHILQGGELMKQLHGHMYNWHIFSAFGSSLCCDR
jgi:hypothetical protein